LDENKQLPPKYIIRYLDEINDEEIEEMEMNENKVISGSERDFVKMRVMKNERVTHIDHFQVCLFLITVSLYTVSSFSRILD
jgi:uncharacterized membrane protein